MIKLLSFRFKSIFSTVFFRNFLLLVSGNVISEIITLLAIPVISRLYAPAEFGLFALYLSIFSIIAVVSNARYEFAVILPENDTDAANIMGLSFFIALLLSVLSLLTIISLYFFSGYSQFDDYNVFGSWLFLMPAFILLNGIVQCLNIWYIRKREFKTIAWSNVIKSVSTNGALLLLGISGFSFYGIFTGNLIGLSIFCSFLVAILFYKYRDQFSAIKRDKMISLGRKYKDFPVSNIPQAIVESLQMNGIIYLISIYFNSAVTGLYSFSIRTLMFPMWIAGIPLAQVFFKEASETYQSGKDVRKLINKILLYSTIIVFPFFLLLILTGPMLFAFVFGNEWREAGQYARILAPWIFLDFIKQPLCQVPIIVGKIRTMLPITIIGTSIILFSMIVGGYFLGDIMVSFVLMSSLMSIYILFLIAWIYKIAKPNSHA